MNYKKYIIELLDRIEDEKLFERIFRCIHNPIKWAYSP